MNAEPYAALKRHDLDQLARTLRAGTDPNAVTETSPRWLPLQAAIEELEYGGPVEALVLLLRAGAEPNRWDGEQDSTPLLMAVFRNQPEAVRILLAAGADPNVVGSEGDSPLRWAVEYRKGELAAMLLRSHATTTIDSAGGPAGMTALGRAASNLDLPMVELLLSNGADLRAQDADLRTAIERLPAAADGDRNDALRRAVEARLRES